MASNPSIVEDHCNTETDEETIALKKKRSRRVSFADREITSVHIFNRDEDYETPPDSSAKNPTFDNVSEAEKEVLGFFRDLADSDDSKEMSPPSGDDNDDDDDDVVNVRKPFLRPIESPSPGSSIIGSATSNDDDNFFGPVSASFIRHGQLSDSAASDDNHDVTMDSTAFSMHYRSLARSDSGGHTFEEKTPSHVTTPSDSGSFMVLTKAKKLIPQVSLPVENVSGGKDSNDMSLIGENPRNYDYGKLSPTLEALIAAGSKDLHDFSVSDATTKKSLKRSEVSMSDENCSGHEHQKDYRDKEAYNVSELDLYTEGVSAACMKLDEVNGVSLTTLAGQITNGCSSHRNEGVAADAYASQQMQTPNQLSKLQLNDDYGKDVIGMSMMNVEIPDVSGDSPQSMHGEVLQSNSFAQHESRQISNKCCSEETSNNRRGNYGISQNSDRQHRSPLIGSISSVSAKQQQVFLDTAKSCRQLSYVTPSPKQSGSCFGKENIRSIENLLPVEKSCSKFKIFEPSPLASALKDGIERSKLRLSKLLSSTTSPFNAVAEENCRDIEGKNLDALVTNLETCMFSVDHKNRHHERTDHMDSALKDGIERSKLRLSKLLSSTTSPFNAVAEENCRDIEGKNLDALVTNLETCMFSVDQKNRHHERTDYMDSAGIGNRKNDDRLSKNEELISLAEDGESLIPMSTHILSKEGDTRLITEVTSPSQLTQRQKKVQQDILMPEKFDQRMVVVIGSDSPSVDLKNDVKTSPLDKFLSHPAKLLDQKSSSSTENQGALSRNIWNDDLVSGGLGQVKTSIGNVTSNSHSTAVNDKSESWFAEGRAQSSSSPIEINHLKDFNQVEKVHDKQSYPSDLQHASETLPNFGTPLRERNALKFLSGNPDQKISFSTDPVHSDEERPEEWNEASIPASASLYIHIRNKHEPSFIKSPFKKEMTQSPSRKELRDVSDDENVQFLARKEILSPNSNSSGPGDDDSHLELQVLLSQIPAQYIEKSSLRKRTEESIPEEADHTDKIRRINKSPNIHKIEGSNTATKHWSDILLKFSTDTQQLLLPLIDKLNIRSISVLHDILVHLQKSKIYEMLCFQIQSQKMFDQSSEVWHKRVAETKMLLYKLLYEKARLQLMSVKREELLKSAQQLSSAIQKSQTLKLHRRCLFLPSDMDTTIDDTLSNSCTVNLGSKHEVSREKEATMKHEFEALDRKIKKLTKSFHSYCKIKGEPSYSETIVLLDDHLKKKISCRFIHEDLQLWEVDDFGSRNGKQNIVLNYQGLICQRFAINDSPIPSIYVSNILNDIIIAKNFPNMDACVAFACVLNAKNTKKHVGSKSFAQETQITSALLHNLLDVVGEVQLAQVELRNLVRTSFRSSSVEQLDLQLCFLNFNNGWKVMVTLDMTCLKCGIYPSDIFPYRLQASIAGTYTSLPESLSAKIKAAVDGVRVGYSRIIQLCRCISQVVKSLST